MVERIKPGTKWVKTDNQNPETVGVRGHGRCLRGFYLLSYIKSNQWQGLEFLLEPQLSVRD